MEAFAGFGWRGMTSKRRECMKKQASRAWRSLKDDPRATPMWSSAKHYQIWKVDHRGPSLC